MKYCNGGTHRTQRNNLFSTPARNEKARIRPLKNLHIKTCIISLKPTSLTEAKVFSPRQKAFSLIRYINDKLFVRTQYTQAYCTLSESLLGQPKMSKEQPNAPLHGITLAMIVTQLEAHYGWDGLSQRININCFKSDPSIKSSLKFLRRTPWAREKVETLYVSTFSESSPWKTTQDKSDA